MRRAIVLLCTLAFALGLLAALARAESVDARFLAALRERRLFVLAERYCTDRLGSSSLSEAQRADLAVELIRTRASHAVHSPPAERDAIWQQARQAAADFRRTAPQHPRLVLVRLQDALTPLAQGELGRQELAAGVLADERLEPARQALREASGLLESLDTDLAREIPLRRRAALRPDELSTEELLSLQQQVRRQLARASRNRALLYPPGTDDRLALLLAACQTLEATHAQIAGDEPLAQAIQLDLAECQRLLGRLDQAAETLAALDVKGPDAANPDAATRLRARAEQLRLAIARSDAAAAERLVAAGPEIDGQSAADLALARFEALLWLAQNAVEQKDAAAARRHQELAVQTIRSLDETYGPYWSRRAEQLLTASLPRGAAAGHAALVARGADSLYLRGEAARAIAAYDDAAGLARAAGDLNGSFVLAYKAALIEENRGRHAEAARRFRTLGKTLATHPQAAETHLLGAWHAAQLAAADPAAADEYALILREHLANWPTSGTAAQARLWLGRLMTSRGDWPAAIEAYGGIPRASPHFADATTGLAAAWREQLAALAAAGQPVEEPAAGAVRQIQQALAGADGHPLATWTDSDRAVAVAAADLALAYQPKLAAQVQPLLQAALGGSPDATAEWKSGVQVQLARLQAEALVASGKPAEALAALAALAKRHPDNGAIQISYARQLAAADDRPSLAAAIVQWKLIASRSQPQSPRWLQASCALAEAELKLGDKSAAAALLRDLLAAPGVKGTAWETKFSELFKRCAD